MNLVETLFYKTDEFTNEKRISKTKTITIIVFILFLLFSLSVYLTTPEFSNTNIILLFIPSVIVGLIFAVPTFIVGKLISKLLNRNKEKIPSNNMNPIPQEYKNINNDEELNKKENECPEEYAKEFKRAVEEDNIDLAQDLLNKWNKDDANYVYASIIFEGMPPTTLSIEELTTMFNTGNNMKSCDESLKDWFKSTAMEVINLNKSKK